mgnify:CR=1 FL=1
MILYCRERVDPPGRASDSAARAGALKIEAGAYFAIVGSKSSITAFNPGISASPAGI